ncbi:MAG TPA: ADP-glyceromanno-heptose 6-epimerase [Chitinophagaceae bacterium]|nr:ADP-glyceromanno-heptose 6-epimerase [Chitinophagaceae bacterium]
MDRNATILLTGAAGFIGSYLLGFLNEKGFTDIIIVDDFSDEDKWFNFDSKQFTAKVEREELFDWLAAADRGIHAVFHLGARTDTTEFDYSILEKINLEYSKKIWRYCAEKTVPLVYASSAATYGAGESGYKDDHALPEILKPLNPYGISKNEFDKWALQQTDTPPFWAGLKFFNVYGPNEYHKGRMASVIFHAYNQIRKNGKVKLFRSHKPEFRDGEQLRDFIYVKDVATVCLWLMDHQPTSGLYNVGTGKARTFNDQVKAIFTSLDLPAQIEYMDTPTDIRDKYQYYTEADMSKLRQAGYDQSFSSLEEGVSDYVKNYLVKKSYY